MDMKTTEETMKIVKIIQEALDNHPDIGETIGVMYKPYNFDPAIGVMVDTENGPNSALGYNIIIEDLSPEKRKFREDGEEERLTNEKNK